MHASLLKAVVEALDRAGIPHMVAGSFASTFHSDPRMTRDIDLVIDPDSLDELASFVSSFRESRFYVGSAESAFLERGMFNVIDIETGWKADLIVRKERPFSVREFARRQPVSISGVETFVASVEDTVLAKLDWSRDSKSTRQFEDVVAMLRAQRDSIDTDYLNSGAAELAVEAALAMALAEAKI